MAKDILALISSKMNTFSKGQKLIANYILTSYDKAAFMTASKLGKTVHVSESTVVRFASELKYDGYPAMQKALQELIRGRLTSVQRIGVTNDRIGNQDVVSMVLHSDMEKLRQTEETIDREQFTAAVNAILKAKRVYILGVRSVAPLANFLGYYLNYMSTNIHVVTTSGEGEMFEKIVAIKPDDVVIAISFPRYSSATVKAAQYCRSAGATVIGLTDSRLSPLGQNADHVLEAKSDMVSLVDSLVAPMSVINALVVAIVALGINSSAPNCEVIRSGLMAVKKGYYEATYALGFSKFQTFTKVIMPIALRLAFKPLTSNFVNMVLTSSTCYGITLMEIMGVAKTVSARSNRPFEVYIILMAAYCIFTYLISFICKAIDKKLEIKL